MSYISGTRQRIWKDKEIAITREKSQILDHRTTKLQILEKRLM